MKKLKEFIPLWRLIKEEKVKIIIASCLLLLSGIAEIFNGFLNGSAVEAITNLDLKKALIFLLTYLLLGLISDSVIYNLGSSMLERIESKLTRKLGYLTYKKSLYMPAYAYEEKTSGEITNRIIHDADTLSFAFGSILNTISSLIGSLLVIVYIFMNSWIIGVEILVFLILLFLIIKKYDPLMYNAHKERKKEQDKFSSLVTESIRGIREIKTLGIKNNLLSDMREIIRQVFNKSSKEIDIRKLFNMLTELLKISLEVGTFIICVILLYYGKITLTFFIAMTYYIYRYLNLIDRIKDLTRTYQNLVVSLGRVNEILENRQYEDDKFGEKELKVKKGLIKLKNVTFAYPNEKVTLDKCNLTLEPNKKIAIVGRSGQGKSTLFTLITRIFDSQEGEILIDGVNIKDITEDSLRKNVSIIRQEPFIFNRTIKENFKLINNKISLKTIRKYAKLAYIDDYIMSLPNKYDTVLGEGGVNLSGGQKQRLAIARTLAKESKIILFDEATSALDNSSQEYIKKAIDGLVKDHTVVIVAHRLSTIMDADVIHIVDKGKVVASGTHDELLEKNEIYKTLYETESLNLAEER